MVVTSFHCGHGLMKILLIGDVLHAWPSKWSWRAACTFLFSTITDDYHINFKAHCAAKPFCIVSDAITHMACDSGEQYLAHSGMLSSIPCTQPSLRNTLQRLLL